jgi:hypothetical protein
MSGGRNTGQILYTHILPPMISRFGYLGEFSFLLFPNIATSLSYLEAVLKISSESPL